MKRKIVLVVLLVLFLASSVVFYTINKKYKKEQKIKYGYSLIGNPKEIYSIGERSWFLGDGDRVKIYSYVSKEEHIKGVTSWKRGRNEEVEEEIDKIIKRIEYPNSIDVKLENSKPTNKMEPVYNMSFSEKPYEYHIKVDETGNKTILINYNDSGFVYLIESFS